VRDPQAAKHGVIAPTRRAPTWLLVVTAASLLPWSYAVNLWFAPRELYSPLLRASHGLLQPALQVCLPSIVLYLLLFRAGGLRLRDTGWHRTNLLAGVVATVALWGLVNGIAMAAVGRDVAWPEQPAEGTLVFIGKLVAQLFGNALWEETIYRGFFLTQLLILFQKRGLGPRRRICLAVLLSAVLFAIPHIPNRIYKGEYDGFTDVLLDQGKLLLSGAFLAWTYLRTGNLWWLVGLHSLSYVPGILFAPSPGGSPKDAVVVIGVVITLLWPRTFGRLTSRTYRPATSGVAPPS
jgi:membrane protease YdiL (CAAX protease family)